MDLISFQIYSAGGAANPSATPIFLVYVDRSGDARTSPDIVHVANGVFGFSPTNADVTTGISWIISTGYSPKYYFGSISSSDNLFQTCMFQNGAGTLIDISGTPPTLAFYKDRLGVDLAPPVIVNTYGGYLWTISPPESDILAGVVLDIVAPAGSYPAHFAGAMLGAPVQSAAVFTPTDPPPIVDQRTQFAVFAVNRGNNYVSTINTWYQNDT